MLSPRCMDDVKKHQKPTFAFGLPFNVDLMVVGV
jgi:hypothetical protein